MVAPRWNQVSLEDVCMKTAKQRQHFKNTERTIKKTDIQGLFGFEKNTDNNSGLQIVKSSGRFTSKMSCSKRQRMASRLIYAQIKE